MEELVPPRLLRNPHLMTITAGFWPRRFPQLAGAERREFETEPGTRVLAECNWQANPRRHATLVLVHGLEGSSRSGYMLGTAEKAFRRGFNVVRLNQRNCGGSDHLSPTLYNSSLSGDVRAVVEELAERDNLPEIFAAGFSMGGNLVLKMAGEYGSGAPKALRGYIGVSPSIDLAACVDAIEEARNLIYRLYFVRRLKQHFRVKARLYPERYRTDGLERVRTIRDFDNAITAPYCGFRDAVDYYEQSSAGRVLAGIARPALLVTAQDDPLIPFSSFRIERLRANPHLVLEAPRYGGHCSFMSARGERFWAEARIVEFCREHSMMSEPIAGEYCGEEPRHTATIREQRWEPHKSAAPGFEQRFTGSRTLMTANWA